VVGDAKASYIEKDTEYSLQSNDLVVSVKAEGFPDEHADSLCAHSLLMHPTGSMRASFHTNKPIVAIIVLFGVFFFAIIVFLTYDGLVWYNQQKIKDRAQKSLALIGTLFPGRIGDQIFRTSTIQKQNQMQHGNSQGEDEDYDDYKPSQPVKLIERIRRKLRGEVKELLYPSKPLAELYPEVSYVMYSYANAYVCA
jgi:hypothetical protein